MTAPRKRKQSNPRTSEDYDRWLARKRVEAEESRKRKPSKPARERTSERVARLAGQMLRPGGRFEVAWGQAVAAYHHASLALSRMREVRDDLRTIAASAPTQKEK